MAKLRVHNFSMSLDGFAAGVDVRLGGGVATVQAYLRAGSSTSSISP